MRFLLRFLSLVCLAGATIAGTIDSIQSVAASALVMTSFGDALKGVSQSTFEKLRMAIRVDDGSSLYAPAVQWVLGQPAFAVLLTISLMFWMVAYRRVPAAGRFAA